MGVEVLFIQAQRTQKCRCEVFYKIFLICCSSIILSSGTWQSRFHRKIPKAVEKFTQGVLQRKNLYRLFSVKFYYIWYGLDFCQTSRFIYVIGYICNQIPERNIQQPKWEESGNFPDQQINHAVFNLFGWIERNLNDCESQNKIHSRQERLKNK